MTAPTDVTFVSGTTISSEWLNGVNDYVNELNPSNHSSANIQYVPSGTGAVTTDVQTKLRQIISVKDFGAIGNGVIDDTSSIQAALNAAKTIAQTIPAYGITVYFPSGVYKITSTVVIPIYVNILGESVEGVIVSAMFNGDAFTEELSGSSSTLYFTRIEEISIYKSETNGTLNTTGKAINFRRNASYVLFRRLRIYGGEYAIYGENVGYSLWNTFEHVMCYYQTVSGIYCGQGSNATRFIGCSFAFGPIGVDFPGTSVGISLHGCDFEGFSDCAIQVDSAQVSVHGGYIEMQTILKSVVKVTGTGFVTVNGAYVRGPGAGYLATMNGNGAVRFNNCRISNYTYSPPTVGTYADNVLLRDNVATDGTNQLTAGTVVGIFTPTLSPTSAGDYTIAYSKQYGRYRKDGNRVTIDVEIVTSSFTHSTAAGYMRIQGIPFDGSSVTGAQSKGSLEFSGVTKAGYTNIVPSIDYTNYQQVIFMCSGSGVSSTTLNIGDMPSGSNKTIKFSLTYETKY